MVVGDGCLGSVERSHEQPRHRDETLVEGIDGKTKLLQGYSTQDWFSAFITKRHHSHPSRAVHANPCLPNISFHFTPIG